MATRGAGLLEGAAKWRSQGEGLVCGWVGPLSGRGLGGSSY